MYQLTGALNAVDTTTDTQHARVKRPAHYACTASRSEYKFINCMKYNLHNKDRKAQENKTSLDRSCPTLQAMIDKYRQNTNY